MISIRNTSALFTAAFVFVVVSLNAQSSNATDSMADERNRMSKQIIQLRDTISIKIISLNNEQASVTPINKPTVEKATRDLKFYQAQLEKGLDEIINTKVWQADIRSRSARLLSDMRGKFKITEKELEKIGYQ